MYRGSAVLLALIHIWPARAAVTRPVHKAFTAKLYKYALRILPTDSAEDAQQMRVA